jgi:PhnB protein
MPTKLHAYLGFDGQCADAMRFYAKTLGAELKALITYAQAPGGECPPGSENRVMHAFLVNKDFELMAGDSPVGQASKMQGFMLALSYDQPAEAKRIFDALADGGQVTMPMAETFWAETFGMCVDRFGTAWAVNGGPKPMM